MLDLPLRLNASAGPPLYQQIAEQIVGFVRAGRLARGSKLPPTRELATAAGVHRNTIIAAYNELQAQGYTDAAPGRGTFIAQHLPEDDFILPSRRVHARHGDGQPTAKPPQPRHSSDLFSDLARELPGVTDQQSFLRARRTVTANLNSGAVAMDLFPWETFRGVLSDVVGRHWRKLAHHDLPLGLESLRVALSSFLFSRGVAADPGEIVITTGSQQAIDLLARLYINRGDVVGVEDPGYPAARQRFALEGARIISVSVDEQGIDTHALERLLRHTRIKLLYVTPNCQWPTAVRLAEDRREALATLAEAHDFIVIEDDYAAELRFRAPAVTPLFMTMPPGRCLNLGSFSKSLLPGLRLGYAVAPAEVSRRMAALKMLTDSHSSLLVQAAVSEFLERGHFETHLRKLRRECRLRLDALSSELNRVLAARMSWVEPDAGSNLWCQLKGGVNATALAEYCRERGLAFTPGSPYYNDPANGASRLLLGFAAIPVDRARATAELLAGCLQAFLDESKEHEKPVAGTRRKTRVLPPIEALAR